MMKKISLLFALTLATFSIQAQPIAYGLQASVIYSYIVPKETLETMEVNGSSTGYDAGIFLRKDFKALFLEADLAYTGAIGGTINGEKVTTSMIRLPVMIGRKFFPGIRLFVGVVPYKGFGRFDEDFGDFRVADRDDIDFDYLLGAGVDISRLTLSVRYEGCLGGSLWYYEGNEQILCRIPMLSLGLGIKLN